LTQALADKKVEDMNRSGQTPRGPKPTRVKIDPAQLESAIVRALNKPVPAKRKKKRRK